MPFDAEKMLKEYGMSYRTTGKNCSPGWINIQCPFCTDNSAHLGINLDNGTANCWNCGKKPLKDVLKALLGVTPYQAIGIIKKYSKNISKSRLKPISEDSITQVREVIFPIGTDKLEKMHCDYLEERNFDPKQLEKDWKILGTSCIGNYKFRIVIPIYFEGRLISYQARDITEEAILRYKACSKTDEIIHHKNILYGIDNVLTDRAIVCEGIFDVWRLGYGAIATFGIAYTARQVLLLVSRFKKIFVLFDSESQAQKQADKLASELVGFGKDVEILDIGEGDPGELSEVEAKEIMKLIS
jgi:DNA primase